MDWKNLIADLRAQGMTQAEIGKHANASQSTICDISKGRIQDPRHSIGDRLCALHRRVMAKARAAKPTTADKIESLEREQAKVRAA